MSRDPALFLEDIQKSCEKIIQFSDGLDVDTLSSDAMRFDAILSNLHGIGEAVKNLPKQFRNSHPEVA